VSPTIIIAVIAIVPVALLFILRINAAIAFLSLCLGSLLVTYVADDSRLKLSGISTKVTSGNLKLLLLLLPLAITMVLMLKSVKKSYMLLNIIPALGAGFLAVLLVVPLLSPHTTSTVIQTSLWQQIQKNQGLLVAASGTVCLLFLALQRPKHERLKHSKHHSM
jgi:hypothetical protein